MKLINADKVIENLTHLKCSIEYGVIEKTRNQAIDECIMEIKYPTSPALRVETLDEAPVKHAHWIEHRTSSGNVHNVCSCCGKEVSYPYAKKRWKYCIECGAKMDEEIEGKRKK